jgi:hypothetical protein
MGCAARNACQLDCVDSASLAPLSAESDGAMHVMHVTIHLLLLAVTPHLL